MSEIEKALRELQKAIENNELVSRVTITITIAKPKTDRAKPKPKTK